MQEKKIRKLRILCLVLLLLMAVFPAILLLYQHHRTVRSLQALVGRSEQSSPEYTQDLLKELYRNTESDEELAKGEEAFGRYGYTAKGMQTLSARYFPAGLLAAVIVAPVSVLVLTVVLSLRLRALQRRAYDALRERQDELQQEIKQLHYLESRNLELRRFIENIAHQLKTPVSRIMSALEMLETDSEREKQECISHVSEISELISSLIRIGRMEAGAVTFHQDEMDLKTLIEDAVQSVGGTGRTELCYAEEGPCPWNGDYGWMLEALKNLLNNCMEHDNSSSGIRVELEQDRDYYRLKIRDHGPGFEEADLPFLFDRFYQASREKKGHVGIGLNLTKLILLGHHASIRAENCPDGGAAFLILLPRFASLN